MQLETRVGKDGSLEVLRAWTTFRGDHAKVLSEAAATFELGGPCPADPSITLRCDLCDTSTATPGVSIAPSGAAWGRNVVLKEKQDIAFLAAEAERFVKHVDDYLRAIKALGKQVGLACEVGAYEPVDHEARGRLTRELGWSSTRQESEMERITARIDRFIEWAQGTMEDLSRRLEALEHPMDKQATAAVADPLEQAGDEEAVEPQE